MKDGLIITLDGPAGAGKSSVSRHLAKHLGYTYVDTGAMYRAIALAADRAGVSWDAPEALAPLLKTLTIEFRQVEGDNHIFLNGKDVASSIRTPHISSGASKVSAHGVVREHLLGFQRSLGERGGAIFEGRDTGTVVFPKADLKLYIDASSRTRAERRYKQLGEPEELSIDDLQREIETRDEADKSRKIAPLCCPEDAVVIDTSELRFDEVIQEILGHIQGKLQPVG
ncbi:MAG TPA: (d)CMP kinase [Myxococcales bacterium]|mgnify:CR=1 FL=1|nr:cytidylate kinase [Deltaproteobacteria bacterium]HAA53531.1 (d)CMP kinase [Myxococcales bacterium]|tara:strand:- start:17115 stop:17795 length:681 start_codon:yes stop_codon:yes gene_type:complete